MSHGDEWISVVGEMRSKFLSARKKKDQVALNALGPLLGDIETKTKGTQAFDISALYGIVRGHINGLKECMQNMDVTSPAVEDMDSQIKILSAFLPKMMSSAQMVEIASEFIKQDDSHANLGKVMAYFKQNHPGQYDGKALAGIIKDLI